MRTRRAAAPSGPAMIFRGPTRPAAGWPRQPDSGLPDESLRAACFFRSRSRSLSHEPTSASNFQPASRRLRTANRALTAEAPAISHGSCAPPSPLLSCFTSSAVSVCLVDARCFSFFSPDLVPRRSSCFAYASSPTRAPHSSLFPPHSSRSFDFLPLSLLPLRR